MSSNTRSVVQITQKLSHENIAKLFQNKRQIFGGFRGFVLITNVITNVKYVNLYGRNVDRNVKYVVMVRILTHLQIFLTPFSV